MTEFTMDRLRENLEALKMKNTLEILDNYLERAVAENLNIVDVLDHIFAEEAKSKRKRAYEKQIQMSGFPIKKTLDDFDFSFQPSIDKRQIDELATMRFLENGENVVFLGPPGVGKTHLASALGLVAAQHRFSTYYINCHQLIEQLKKAHFENRLPDKLRVLSKYKMLIIDEIGYLSMDIQGANLFFQLIARRYEKTSTVFTSNKTLSQWNEVFADVTIASAILDRVLHHCTVINIKGESYRLKERKEFMRQKQQIVNTLFQPHQLHDNLFLGICVQLVSPVLIVEGDVKGFVRDAAIRMAVIAAITVVQGYCGNHFGFRCVSRVLQLVVEQSNFPLAFQAGFQKADHICHHIVILVVHIQSSFPIKMSLSDEQKILTGGERHRGNPR